MTAGPTRVKAWVSAALPPPSRAEELLVQPRTGHSIV